MKYESKEAFEKATAQWAVNHVRIPAQPIPRTRSILSAIPF